MKRVEAISIDFLKNNSAGILIRVIETKGSAPRGVDAFMLVDSEMSIGTVGGGRLEWEAIKKARELILCSNRVRHVEKFQLGPELGQCCGGVVTLSFEWLTNNIRSQMLEKLQKFNIIKPTVLIFGAGHVGTALIEQLKLLPLNYRIIDSRPDILLTDVHYDRYKITPIPEAEIREAPTGSAFVIVTHDHALDFLLVKEALLRDDSTYVGMIGSKTKKAQLIKLLKKHGITSLKPLVTPLGSSISKKKFADKRPESIAALTIAEILLAFQSKQKVF